MSTRTPWLVGTLVAAAPLNPAARSITFEVPGWPGNLAGQHVDVRLTAPDGYQAVRSYSIASSGLGTRVELAIDKLPDGEVSPFLVDALEINDPVELRGPLGGWFVWTDELHTPVQLIAGGSGVVPFVAMAREHRRTGSAAPMRLLYSLKGPDDAFFRDELTAPPRTTWMSTGITHGITPPGWEAEPRRLTSDDLRNAVIPPTDDARIYICGPTGFVETVSRSLESLGHRPESIRTERFGGV